MTWRTARTAAVLLTLQALAWSEARPQAAQAGSAIADLKSVVGFPDNTTDAGPYYAEIAEWVAGQGLSSEDLRSKPVELPGMERVIQCGVYAPELPCLFEVRDGSVVFLEWDFPSGIAVLSWIRGLHARIDEHLASGRPGNAWEEIRRALIVGLQYYEAPSGVYAQHLYGSRMLSGSLRTALRCDVPEVKANEKALRAALEQVTERDQLLMDLGDSIAWRRMNLRLSRPGDSKVVFDFLQLLSGAIAHRNDTLGEVLFGETVGYLGRARCEPCWQIMFSSYDKLKDGTNWHVRCLMDGLFLKYDREELKRMLTKVVFETDSELRNRR